MGRVFDASVVDGAQQDDVLRTTGEDLEVIEPSSVGKLKNLDYPVCADTKLDVVADD